MNKFISILVVLLCLGLFTNCYAGIADKLPVDRFSNKYDIDIRKASKRFFGVGFNWKLWKAQAIAESALNPNAVSPVKAAGLLQIMPATYKEIRSKLSDVGPDPFNVRWNINASIYYSSRLWKQWSSPRPWADRACLVMASYNGGLGNSLRAQKKCIAAGEKTCNMWNTIKTFAPEVKQWKYHESLNYTTKIMRLIGYEGY